MEVVCTRGAGLDVHKKTVTACRCVSDAGAAPHRETRTFGTTTRELLKLRDWLQEAGCTQVAMESTGVYWQPVYNILEGGFTLLVVNAKHVKHVPGRKTDVRDAEWLAELLRHGLLKASFVPPRAQRELRELTRQRATMVGDRAAVANRVQKVLESANIKLASVASDVIGVSGRAMLAAMLAGTEDPAELAKLAKGRLREKRVELEAALEGQVRAHHRFLISQLLAHLEFLDGQIARFDVQIDAHLRQMDEPSDPPPAEPERDTDCASAAQSAPSPASGGQRVAPEKPLRYAEAVRLLDPIPGVAERGAQAILAETGTDMRRFASAAHLASWAGVAPGNNESAGKRRSGKTTDGNPALRKALAQAAHGAKQTKGSYFGALYRRIAARRGKRRAIVAVSHALLVVIYHMLLYHEPYRELGRDYYDERRKEGLVEYLIHRIEKLGYEATVQPKATRQDACLATT